MVDSREETAGWQEENLMDDEEANVDEGTEEVLDLDISERKQSWVSNSERLVSLDLLRNCLTDALEALEGVSRETR